MDGTCERATAATTTWLFCLRGDDDGTACRQRLERLCADGRREVLVVGCGPPGAAEDLLRDLSGNHPRLRVLLHRRAVSRTEALCAGVAAARTPWIVLPGAGDPLVSPIAAVPGPDVDCVPLGDGSVLFSREAFARLRPIPGMARWLSDLFACSGLRVVPAGATPPASWLRRAGIAVLCTMAGIAAPAAFRA